MEGGSPGGAQPLLSSSRLLTGRKLNLVLLELLSFQKKSEIWNFM